MSRLPLSATHDDPLVYAGTYTTSSSEGIYTYRLDMSTGALTQTGVARAGDNPSYLAIDAARRRLFAVNETSSEGGRAGGRISALAIAPSSGALSLINQQDSGGGAPCHLALDDAGRYLFHVNYLGGNVVVTPIGEDGSLGTPTHRVTHAGSSIHPERQTSPHPHAVVLGAQSKLVYVPDLGLDRVMQYRFDRQSGQLYANEPAWVSAEAGSGPRHMVLHPRLACAYVINELRSTVTVYARNAAPGVLDPVQTMATLPDAHVGTNIAAALHLAPGGRFLYASNRGHDSIAVFAVNQDSGLLTHVQCVSTLGSTPRDFVIDPTGTYLLVANQDSDRLVTFRVNRDAGTITFTGHKARTPNPVCLKILTR